MKSLIIDDEQGARNLLETLVHENCSEITEIFTASSLLEGIALIKTHKPEILFLDIEMPEHSGLEILDFIDKDVYNFEIIFTTAYASYAIKAIQMSAMDYLLKPISAGKIKEAVEKVAKHHGNQQLNERIEALRIALKSREFKKIGLPVSDGVAFVDFDNIVMLEADRMYTKVYTKNENLPMLISKPLKYFVELFESLIFFYKPHRSYLINIKHIKKYVKSDGGYIIMDNEQTVSLSKERTTEFMELMQQF